MSQDDPSKTRASILARALEQRADELGMRQKEVASYFGFGEAYYSLLLSGERWFGTLSQERLKKISQFLDVPLVSTMIMADIINSDDFFRESTLANQLDEGYKLMSQDRRFTLFVPKSEDWQRAPLSVKLLACVLYNDVSKKYFMEQFELIKPTDIEQADGSSDEIKGREQAP